SMEAERRDHDPRLRSLRWIIFAGEALDVGQLRAWFDRYGDSQPALMNMYGPPETTVLVTWRHLQREDSEPGRPSVIGRPLPGAHVYVVDDEGQPVPRGVAGELWIGG